MITPAEATAEVFWTAFRHLQQKDQQAFLQRMLEDEMLRRDLIDLALIAERRNEPSRPLREYLSESRR